MNISASLPSSRSTPCIATSEPSASPSGFSCVTRRKRSFWRTASRTCSRVPAVGGAHRVLLGEQLLDVHRAVGRLVVDERQRRRALHPQLASRPAAGAARARTAAPPATRRAVASSPRTVTNTRAWRRSGLVLTSVTVTKPMRGSLRPGHSVAEDLADRLVDAAHAVAGHTISSNAATVRSTRTPCGQAGIEEALYPVGATARPHPANRRPRRPRASSAARGPGGRPRSPTRRAASAQPRLDRRQVLALGLQAPGVGEVTAGWSAARRTPSTTTRRARARPGASRRPP